MLGQRIKAGGGRSDGEQVLDILAAHPSTARFIATKLARRFVSDTPPPALVDRAGRDVHGRRDGDLREVMRTLLTSPEFLVAGRVSRQGQDAVRVRRQRAARHRRRRRTTHGRSCASLQQLGMPLYQCQPPTGYKDTADAWVNTGALVEPDELRAAAGRQRRAIGVARLAAAVADRAATSTLRLQACSATTSPTTTRATIAKATDRRADASR